MRTIISILLATSLLTGTALAAEKKTIRLAHSHQPTMESEEHFPGWIFQQYVNGHSDTLNVTLHPASSLGSEREIYEAMQLGGGATCMMSGTAILSNFTKRIAIVDTPFLWADYDHAHRAFDGKVGQELAKDLQGLGLTVAAWIDSWGYRNVLTRKPIKTAEDLRGLKIRTIQTPVYIETINAMGATAAPMAFGEVYSAMQTGVIDGLEHGAPNMLNMKFYEVGKFYTLTEHLYGPLVWACSSKFMSGLTPEESKVFNDAVQMSLDVNRGLAKMREVRSLKELESKGVTIVTIDTTEMQSKAASIQDKIAKESNAVDLLEEIRRLRTTKQ